MGTLSPPKPHHEHERLSFEVIFLEVLQVNHLGVEAYS
jgi:hypothetical protein